MKHRVLAYGKTGTGKTRWAATWPKPHFVSAAIENGFDTVEGLKMYSSEIFYDPKSEPKNTYVQGPQDFLATLEKLQQEVRSGNVETIVVDSLTFYAEAYLEHLQNQGIKGWDLYGALKEHLRKVMIRLHQTPCHVLWLALASEAEDSGGLLIAGRATAQTVPALVSNVLYFTARGGGKNIKYEIHTRPYGKFNAKVRANPMMPDPIPGNNTFRDFEEALFNQQQQKDKK